MLIAADHLIEHISSNPLISRPLGGERRAGSGRPRALIDLHALAAEDARDGPSSWCCPATATRSPTT